MSSIEKLSIRGIRSFSPSREEIIEFYHPLTVILGENGSGKTTVIECLKVACTGSLPPGARSGQSFVHDPRIAGTSEVKASVRLRLRNMAGKPMVVQRTFQLTQSKSGAKFKALDGAVRVKNELGESVSMSHKCAELDRHIPEMLGVSKAILESVIFCHQEDSNWPLQEGAVLKKRFDDIFESARYTKALEAIRKLKKARGDNAKDFKRDLTVLSVKLKGAEEIRQKIEVAEVKLQETAEEAMELDKSIDVSEETHAELEQLLADIKKEHDILERLQNDATQKEQSIQAAQAKIEQWMSDTDEELNVILKNHDAIIEDHLQAVQSLENQESQLELEQKDTQKKFTELSTEKGVLESKIQAQQALVTELLNLASQAGTKYEFHPQPVSSQDDDLKSFLDRFQRFVATKSSALAESEAQIRKGDDSSNAVVSDINAKLHHTKEQLKSKQIERSALNEEKRKNAAALKEFNAGSNLSARDISEAGKLVDEAQKALQNFKDQHNTLKLKSNVEGFNKKISEITYDIDRDNKTIENLRRNERDYISLEAKQQEILEKEDRFREQLADKAAEYRIVIGDDVPTDEGSLDSTIERLETILSGRKEILGQKEAQLYTAESDVRDNVSASKEVEKTLDTMRLEKSELERGPVGDLRRMLEEIAPGGVLHNAEEIVQQAEKAYFAAKDKTLRCKNTITFLTIFKEKGMKEKNCPLCMRGMSPDEQELFVRTINEKTDDKKVKDKIKKAETAEEIALRKWKEASDKLPKWRKWKQLDAQIVEKSTELESLYAAKRALQSDANDKTHQREKAKADVLEVEEAIRAFSSLMGAVKDLVSLRSKCTAEESRLRSQDADFFGPNAPSLASVQKARDEKQSDLQEMYRKLQSTQAEVERLQDIQQQLQTDLHTKRENKSRADEQKMRYDAAVSEQGKLRDREKLLADEISALTNADRDLNEESRARVAELQTYRSESATKLKKLRQEEQQCKQELISLQDKWRKIQDQSKLKLDVKLKRIGEEIARLKHKETAAAQALEDISPQIKDARRILAEGESFKRHVRDNIEFRNLRKELGTIRLEVEEAKRKISTLPSLDEVSRRARAANSAVVSTKEERATLRGRQQQLEQQIREEKVKLRSAEYRNIEEKHRQKLIQYETTVMAVSDLDKYYKALDKSLLQFHSKKVEEINSIIKSLWQITYRGQDIDTIEVISGQEVDTGSGSKAHRSYDYRVVMKKGGALIDMRGRCSAGQKVLAALVIRLALAETFCLNCGILALDEPTTNLDTENKLGLAQAIRDILNARSAQQNFQLVCITHDEEFVQMLSEAQAMDGTRPEYYWRVSREDIGNNRFCSKIERREWRDGV